MLRTYNVRWSEIDRIDPPPPYGTLRKAGLRINLLDGRVVSSSLYAAGPLNRSGFADDVVASLRAEHARHS